MATPARSENIREGARVSMWNLVGGLVRGGMSDWRSERRENRYDQPLFYYTT